MREPNLGLRSPEDRMRSRHQIRFKHGGRDIVVRSNDGHPSQYIWIDVDGARYFLGVLRNGETRGEMKARALAWLEERTRLFK